MTRLLLVGLATLALAASVVAQEPAPATAAPTASKPEAEVERP
jgi:hypothetical protein